MGSLWSIGWPSSPDMDGINLSTHISDVENAAGRKLAWMGWDGLGHLVSGSCLQHVECMCSHKLKVLFLLHAGWFMKVGHGQNMSVKVAGTMP